MRIFTVAFRIHDNKATECPDAPQTFGIHGSVKCFTSQLQTRYVVQEQF